MVQPRSKERGSASCSGQRRWHGGILSTYDLTALLLSDSLLSLAVRPCAWVLRRVRSEGLIRFPRSSRILEEMGLLPVRDHYYEPYLRASSLHRSLSAPRVLPGLDLCIDAQLELLRSFEWQDELEEIPMSPGPIRYGYRNWTFGPVDAGLLYCMVRRFRPSHILEVGCGMSTLLIRHALEQGGLSCEHVCVEPFEQPWLDELPVCVLRQPIELMDPEKLAGTLGPGDLLFIDSSHVVKPQGDVVFVVQELLPRLAPGVIVHFHDIFTPRDYPPSWVLDARVLWAEQYLLESFLCNNPGWQIILSSNVLAEDHHEALAGALPIARIYQKGILPDGPPVFPNSFYFRRASPGDAGTARVS